MRVCICQRGRGTCAAETAPKLHDFSLQTWRVATKYKRSTLQKRVEGVGRRCYAPAGDGVVLPRDDKLAGGADAAAGDRPEGAGGR